MINRDFYNYGTNACLIRDIAEYGKKRVAEVGKENVYDFSIGNPSVPAPQRITDTIRRLVTQCDPVAVHGYTSASGDNDCRDAIAKDLNERFGTSYTRDNLYMTCGAAASLISAVRAVKTGDDSEILTIAPFFSEYQCYAEGNGFKFNYVSADTESFQIKFDELESKITPSTQGLIINSPNNPSGVVYSAETLEKLSALLTAKSEEYGHCIYLISDEPYRELVYDGIVTPFAANYYKNTLVCYSYSKSLSLPGERIGYVLVPDTADDWQAVYAAVAGAARVSGYICAPSVFQHTIAECADVRPDMTVYAKNRKLLHDILTSIGYECADPDGAFYMFVKAPNGDDVEFAKIAMKYDLLLVPGESFCCRGFLRAAYCVPTDMIERSVTAFRKAFEEATK